MAASMTPSNATFMGQPLEALLCNYCGAKRLGDFALLWVLNGTPKATVNAHGVCLSHLSNAIDYITTYAKLREKDGWTATWIPIERTP